MGWGVLMLTSGDSTRGEGPAFQLRPESHPDKSSPAGVWSWEKQQHGQGGSHGGHQAGLGNPQSGNMDYMAVICLSLFCILGIQ